MANLKRIIVRRDNEPRRAPNGRMTLEDRVLQIDHIQARRFRGLNEEALEIAAEGIIRHLRACARMEVNPDASAVREIIDDALNGRRIFAETNNDLLEGKEEAEFSVLTSRSSSLLNDQY